LFTAPPEQGAVGETIIAIFSFFALPIGGLLIAGMADALDTLFESD
jgi:hypothetical protein